MNINYNKLNDEFLKELSETDLKNLIDSILNDYVTSVLSNDIKTLKLAIDNLKNIVNTLNTEYNNIEAYINVRCLIYTNKLLSVLTGKNLLFYPNVNVSINDDTNNRYLAELFDENLMVQIASEEYYFNIDELKHFLNELPDLNDKYAIDTYILDNFKGFLSDVKDGVFDEVLTLN